MVFNYTCNNFRILKSVLVNGDSSDLSPCEYIKTYIENCDDPIDDLKRCWIAKTYLDIMKHKELLAEIITHLPFEQKSENQEYLMITIHGIIFQMSSSDMLLLYKCLFSLSKSLLSALSNSLKNDEFITCISQIAQSIYDTNYVTERIIEPLLSWQPSMAKMAQMYTEYLKKRECSKIRPLTIPIQPKVLKVRSKSRETISQKLSFPATPPNSVLEKPIMHMLTKDSIDKKLKHAHEINKQKAMKLLNEVKKETSHDAPKGYDEKLKKCCNVPDEMEKGWQKSFPKSNYNNVLKEPLLPVKDTVATLRRLKERIKLTEEEEIQWLQDLLNDCKNTGKIQELEEYDREERERERVLDIEKKHLLGQISFEEAVLAKKKVHEDNKIKCEELLKQKEIWNKEIEKWKKEQMEVNRQIFEKLSLLELNIVEARKKIANKKKEDADMVKKESEAVILEALKNKQEELNRKIQMIKEIKILAIIAKRAKLPKIIDLTETSGIGLLCEMSIAELQERLSSMKISLKEELETKHKLIKEKNIAEKNALNETRKTISNFLEERKSLRENFKNAIKPLAKLPSKEIDDLKTVLKAKRELRLRLTS
ncbi:cilia- and flagella-associated protein 99-like [Battus philenor]|uniref:cilia- and flagella-associated protein 99-like n=1 Tax=Battus philenor TaxID=42288 RepID=UPI0035CFFD14